MRFGTCRGLAATAAIGVFIATSGARAAEGGVTEPEPRTSTPVVAVAAGASLLGAGETVAGIVQADDNRHPYLVGTGLGMLAVGVPAGIASLTADEPTTMSSPGLAAGGVALMATGVWLRGSWRRRALMATYGAVAATLGHAPIRALRLGSADEPADYVTQLAGWARTGAWTSATGVDYRAGLAGIGAAVRAWVGTADRLCSIDDARALVAPIAGATLRTVGRAHGDAIDPDHFTLLNRDALAPVWREVAAALTA